jgi:hypothetical protein
MAFQVAYASKVEVISRPDGFVLHKDGEPYFIKGAGGTVELEKLKEYGGNSIRTWGITPDTDQILDEAHRLGLTVTFGIWMGQERQGFDYANQAAVDAQLEYFRQTVRKYKDHPAILLWGVGNEMDLDYTNFDVWKHLEKICQMVHEEDPNHPTIAVTAGLDVAEVKLINKHCPSLDILGLNTYGDIGYLPQALRETGWKKPYVVTEWGPYGWWEVEKTEWGAALEETSTQKAKTYRKSMDAILSDKSNCLGSYVFLWGQKQEHTTTWFGLFTEAGDETGAMDVLIEAWSGAAPNNHCPEISALQFNGQQNFKDLRLQAGQEVSISVDAKDADKDEIWYEWLLIPESKDKKTGGDVEKAPKPLKGYFGKSSRQQSKVTFNAPQQTGAYRVFLFVHDGHGNVATANIPFWSGE